MADLAKLVVRLEAQSAQLQTELDKANKKLAGFERQANKTLGNIKKAFLGFVGFKGLSAIVSASAEAAKNFALLENAVSNAGAAAGGRTAQQFADTSEQLQHITTFSDDAVQGVQQLLLRFQNIRTDRFDEATKAVLDFATATGRDASSAAELLGKALSNPEKGLAALAKTGVTFSDSQTKIIKNLVDTGRRAEAQGIILDKLNQKFGGAAEAARNNFGGALEGLKNDFDNLLEANGGLPGATDAVNDFSKVLQDPAVREGADALFSAIIRGAAEAAKFIAEMAGGLTILAGSRGEIQDLDGEIEALESTLKSLHDQNPFPDEFAKQQIDEKTAALARLRYEQEKLLGVGQGGADAARAGGGARARGPQAQELPDIEVLAGQTEEAAKAAAAALKKLEDEAKALVEATASPLEKYQTSVAKADDLLAHNLITLDTWARAVGGAREELDKFNESAAETAPKSLDDLNHEFDKSLEGGLTPDQQKNLDDLLDAGTDEVLDDFEATAGKAFKQVTVFAEQAARNTQDILADGLEGALEGGIKKGAEGALEAFGDMLEKMALQAIAAKLTEKIFGPSGGTSGGVSSGGGGWLDSAISLVGNLFASRDSGGRGEAGVPYMIGRKAQPEMFIPDSAGEFIPRDQWQGGGGSVTQNIYTSSPITARSASQLALETSKRQRLAQVRLG